MNEQKKKIKSIKKVQVAPTIITVEEKPWSICQRVIQRNRKTEEGRLWKDLVKKKSRRISRRWLLKEKIKLQERSQEKNEIRIKQNLSKKKSLMQRNSDIKKNQINKMKIISIKKLYFQRVIADIVGKKMKSNYWAIY